VYGVYKILKKIITKYNPEYMGICFDVSRKTFRQEKFKEYKMHRPPLPEALKLQFPLVKKLIGNLGVKMIEKEGFEADDVIASLCKKALKGNSSVVIVSSDKDLCQLIEAEKVSVYNDNKDKFINRDDFLGEYGFSPELVVDYLSLTGDSSDNIPGAKGIGKVGAAKLIREFGCIKNIFDNLDKIPKKTQDILVKNKETIFLSRELVELQSPDLELGWEDLKIKDADSEQIYEMFSELEFRGLLKELSAPILSLNIEVKEGVFEDTLRQLIKNPVVFFTEGEKIFVLDYINNYIYKTNLIDLKNILEDPQIKKISYGFKNQPIFFNGIDAKGIWFDVKIAAYLSDSSLVDYSLTTLVSHYLGEHSSQIPAKFSPYFIYKLYELLSGELKKQNLEKLFYEVEMPLVRILSKMQNDGVKVDINILNDLLGEVDKKIVVIKKKIFQIAGKEFNLNSPKQLRVVLFEELGIKPLKKTKTGYSTGEEILDKLSSQYPIAGFILEYRQLNKLKTTYIGPLIEEVKKNNGMLHAQFNQTVAQTGRLSSSSPNLQSIPVKGDLSHQLRKAFVSSFEGGCLISGDYSQIELRILAHLSGDKNLLEGFRQELDIHSLTAALLFGIEKESVDSTQRDLAKRVNFGIVYGMSSYGLAKELKITPLEAQNFIDDYFRRYPGVKDYIDKACDLAEKEGFVKTILDRRRRLPDINSSNIQLKEFARRQAINAPIQGSCADLVKTAMLRIYNELNKRKLQVKLIMQIHDELIFDAPGNEVEEVKTIVREFMEAAIKLNVPVKVNIKSGKNWAEAK